MNKRKKSPSDEWKKNSKGQDLVHEGLITRFLENLMLPEETAIVHAPGYQ
jgi:hypothetical protein